MKKVKIPLTEVIATTVALKTEAPRIIVVIDQVNRVLDVTIYSPYGERNLHLYNFNPSTVVEDVIQVFDLHGWK
jgi:hypothetical protein